MKLEFKEGTNRLFSNRRINTNLHTDDYINYEKLQFILYNEDFSSSTTTAEEDCC